MNSRKTKRRQRAIVIGGSFAGLMTARILSDHFEQVTLIERDKINDRPEARKGQPQVIHPHTVLANGLNILTRYFPDLPDTLRKSGASITDVGNAIRWHVSGDYRRQFESGLYFALVSRPLLEWEMRRRVFSLPNVSTVDQSTVTALLSSGKSGRVTGVQTLHQAENRREEKWTAELVIDTTGRGSAGLRWLEALGYAAPEENAVKIGLGYTTRIYRRQPGDLAGAELIIIAAAPPNIKRAGLFVPMEDDRWNLSLVGWGSDHAPTDEAGYLEFARSLAAPDISNILPRLEPLTDFFHHKTPSNLRREYQKLTRFPSGYLVLGDAIASFNPVYAQAMSSAALQAAALDEILTSDEPLDTLWKPFFKRAAKVVDLSWNLAVGMDFSFPETRGRKSRGTTLKNAYLAKLQRATHCDTVVYGAFLKVSNLLAPRKTLFHPPIMWRVFRNRK